jgi:hypothetical protein
MRDIELAVTAAKHVQGNVHVNLSGENQELARQPMPSGERSFNKYGAAGLLASSATRGWANLAAELRSHCGTVAWNNPQPDAEICVDVRGSRPIGSIKHNCSLIHTLVCVKERI